MLVLGRLRQGHAAYQYNAVEEFSTPIRNESRSLSLFRSVTIFRVQMLSTSLTLSLFSPSQRSPLPHFRIYILHRRSARSIVCTTFAKPFTSSSASGGYILPGNRTATRVISHPLSRRATHRDTRAVGRADLEKSTRLVHLSLLS